MKNLVDLLRPDPLSKAIKGVWDVTPSYTAPSTVDPVLTGATYVTIAGTQITTDLQSAPNAGTTTERLGGVFLNQNIDFVTDTTKSYRIRLTFNGDDIAPGNDRKLHFGLIPTSYTVTQIEEALDQYNVPPPPGPDSGFMVTVVKQNDGVNDLLRVHTTMFDGTTTPSGNTEDIYHFVAGLNTLDIYVSIFDGAAVGNPPGPAVAVLAVVNEQSPISLLANSASFATTLRPFTGVSAIDDGTGNGVTLAEISYNLDYTAAPTTVPVAWTGAPLTQEQFDVIIGAPVSSYATVIPAQIAQVTSVPTDARVNDLYLIDVDPAFVGGVHNVKPFGRFVRKDEVVRIVNTQPGSEEIDVVNIWRDEGGEFSSVETPVEFANYTFTPTTSNVGTPASVTELSPAVYEIKPTYDPIQSQVISDAVLNCTFTYGESILRWEHTARVLNNSVDQTPWLIYAYNPSGNSVNAGERDIVIQMLDYAFGSGDPASAPDQYRIFNFAAVGDNVAIEGVYYKVFVDADPNLTVGAYTTYGYFQYYDALSGAVYLRLSSMANAASGQPSYGSWTPGVTTVNIIAAVQLVLRIDQPAIATVDGFSPTPMYITNETAPYYTVGSYSESIVGPPNQELTPAYLESIFDSLYGSMVPTGAFMIILPQLSTIKKNTTATTAELPLKFDYFHFWILNQQDSVLQYAHYGYVYPELVDGFTVKDNTAIALEYTATDIILRYINSNDQEVTISLVNDIAPANGANHTVREVQSIYVPVSGNVINVPLSAFHSNLETGDVTVKLAWYPSEYNKGLPGVNEVAPIIYTKDVDFQVTNTDEITMLAPMPSDTGWFQLIYDKAGTGLHMRSTEFVPGTLRTIPEHLTHIATMTSWAAVHLGAATVETHLDNFQRPNPSLIGRLSNVVQTLTPACGEFFSIDEDFDPANNQEMRFQVKNALARVVNSGTFNGKQFTAGNFARWNGYETVPFPDIPAVDTSTLELKKNFYNFAANLVTSVDIDLASEGLVYYTTDPIFYYVSINMEYIRAVTALHSGFTFYVIKKSDTETITFTNEPAGISANDIQFTDQIYAVTYINAAEGWKIFGPQKIKTTEDYTIMLTSNNPDGVTRFSSFKDAMTNIYNNIGTTGTATLWVDGQFNVSPDAFYLNFTSAYNGRIKIKGIPTVYAGLIFNLFEPTTGWDNVMFGSSAYFNDFNPYLEDIYIKPWSGGIDAVGSQAARSAFWLSYDQVFNVGDNVTFYDDQYASNNPGICGAVGVINDARIIAGRNFSLIRSNVEDRTAPIAVQTAGSTVTIIADTVITTGSSHVPITGPNPVMDTYKLIIKDRATNYDKINTSFLSNKHYSHGFSNAGVTIIGPLNNAKRAIVNAKHHVANTNGLGVLRVPVGVNLGDTFQVCDYGGVFDNAYGFPVNDAGTLVTTFINAATAVSYTGEVVLKQKYGTYQFTYVGNFTWLYDLVSNEQRYRVKPVTSPYTLLRDDADAILLFDSASACTINIFNTQPGEEFPAGWRCKYRNKNATPGNITIDTSASGYSMNGVLQGSAVTTDSSKVNELYLEEYIVSAAMWVATGPSI